MGPITARRGFHDRLAESVDIAHTGIVSSLSKSAPKSATVSTVSTSSKDRFLNGWEGIPSTPETDTTTDIDGLVSPASLKCAIA